MPADRSRPHTTSASDPPDTTVKTTASPASTPRRLLVVERAHGREAGLAVEQMAEEEGDAEIAGEQRVAAAADRGEFPLDLADRVQRERARPLEPQLVARPSVEDEERVRVARRTVTQAWPLRERAGAPRQLAAGDSELEVE